MGGCLTSFRVVRPDLLVWSPSTLEAGAEVKMKKASRVGAETRQEQNCLKIGYFDALNMGLNKCKKMYY